MTGDRDADLLAAGGHGPDRPVLRGAIGVGAATVVNIVVYALAVADGVTFRLGGQADVFETFQAFTSGFRRVHAYNVAIDTAVPFLVGVVLFRLAARWSRAAALGVLGLAAGAVVLVLIALPHVARMSSATLGLLSAMDVIAGAIFLGVLIPALPPRAPAPRASG
jgi:ABC-type methionine transport system permease subunit